MSIQVCITKSDSHVSVTCQIVVSPIIIHCRLGHPSLGILKKLVLSLNNLSSLYFTMSV